MENFRIIGQPVSRKDGLDIVTGNVVYSVDVSLPGMLHGKVVRSSIASGRVARIDVTHARALPGVAALITAADVPSTRFGYAITDEQIFATEKIRYSGEPLAAVAAVDEPTADEAARLVEVDCEEAPGVFDALEAMAENAPLVHQDMASYKVNPLLTRNWNPSPGTNILHQAEFSRGEVDRGFREADQVFEDTFRTRRLHQCYLEPHGCVAKVEGGKITVWTSTQRPFVIRSMLATIFGVPEGAVRVISTKIGGGFGGKNGVRIEHFAVALAMKTGRPVKVVMRRDEEFTASAGSVPAIIIMKTGVKRDGTITARGARFVWDCGAYSDSLPTSNRAIKDAAGPYRIPHVKVTSTLVYTNTLRGCPFRGLGCPESVWAGESQMDMIAHRLGLDPVELRLKNLLNDGDVAPTGEILDKVTARECLERIVTEIGPEKLKRHGQSRGVGISIVYKSPTGAGAVSSAVVSINSDGSVQLIVGSSDVGGGMETVLSQIAAEELGVAVADVSVISGDTSIVPFDNGTYSSRVTVSSGQAVRRAAVEARNQLLEITGRLLERDPTSLLLKDKQIFWRQGEGGIPVQTVFSDRRCPHKNIVATGFSYEDGKETGWRFGAQAVEIEVDQETGSIKVLKVVSAHDVGKAINPPLVTGQVEGGVVMGLGYALREKLQMDDGRITNPTFSDYGIPFAQEIPPIQSIILESPLAVGPFGAKGIGEIGIFGIAPAVANALENAIGIRLTELPLSPERVLDAIESEQ
ncbi:MAG: xanthine dehydrogenase family protein molybdopterin-binding subunit [Candidatus Binatia bacterium]